MCHIKYVYFYHAARGSSNKGVKLILNTGGTVLLIHCTVFRMASILSGSVLTNFRFLGGHFRFGGHWKNHFVPPPWPPTSFLASNLRRGSQIHSLEPFLVVPVLRIWPKTLGKFCDEKITLATLNRHFIG